MVTDTKTKIIEYISKHDNATAKGLTDELNISSRAIFRHLNTLVASGVLKKIGTPPKVFYILETSVTSLVPHLEIDNKTKLLIDEEFIMITPEGTYMEGLPAFVKWCNDRNYDIEQKAQEFASVFNKYDAYRKNGLIDGTSKLQSTFSEVWLDKLYYLDFYSVEIFGKTKLGTHLLYAKQSQNKKLIKDLVTVTMPKIYALIEMADIDCVGFVPPTVKREVQFMKEFENMLKLSLDKLNIVKVKTEIIIPQKTLSKLTDRVKNAEYTFVVDDTRRYNNILLLDDAVGSGATLNQLAKAIKNKGLVKGKVIGCAITGSLKGFDVISEV